MDRWQQLGGARVVACAGVGGFGLAYVGAVVFVSSGLRGGQRGASGARRGCAPVGVYRRHRWAKLFSARILDGWLTGGSRGSRTTPPSVAALGDLAVPTALHAASGSNTCRSRTPARHALCWTTCR